MKRWRAKSHNRTKWQEVVEQIKIVARAVAPKKKKLMENVVTNMLCLTKLDEI